MSKNPLTKTPAPVTQLPKPALSIPKAPLAPVVKPTISTAKFSHAKGWHQQTGSFAENPSGLYGTKPQKPVKATQNGAIGPEE